MKDYKKYEPLFGSWYLGKLLGKGSFGRVYEIKREEFGREYRAALKIISIPQEDEDIKSRMIEGTDIESVSAYYEGVLQEIINENEIMSQLKGNSNIVSYEDHMIIPHEDGIGHDILIKMELLTPLVDYLLDHTMEEEDVIRLGMDMCRALELCHNKNIIHRDIKPQNIFLSDSGNYKLGDFGIARTIEKTTGGLSKKGTYKYMAPEVYRGDEYGMTVDLYSLGMVMYTLLNSNRSPFLPQPPEKVTHNLEETARARRFRGEPLPAPVNASTALSQIILKACAFYPQDRYRTAAEMRLALEYLVEDYEGRRDETVQMIPGSAPIPPYAASGAYTQADYNDSIRQTAGYNDSYSHKYQNEYRPGPGYKSQQALQPGFNPPDDHSTFNRLNDQPVEVQRKTSKVPIIGAAAAGVICLAIGLFVLFNGQGVRSIDMSELMPELVVRGYDGYGSVSSKLTADSEKEDEILNKIKDADKRDNVRALIESITFKADDNEMLSNGDLVTVHATCDESLAEELGIEVSGYEKEVEIESLEPLPDYMEGAEYLEGHFYKLVDDAMYWTEARSACEEMGGHLATILSREEEDLIEEMIESEGNLYHYWLGATDEDSEGDWRWITGERVPLPGDSKGYENWCFNQPNNNDGMELRGQDYMEIQKTRGDGGDAEYLTWTDIGDSGHAISKATGLDFDEAPDYNSTRYYGYICEWDPEDE